MYRVGPYGSFVGTAVSDVRVGGPADNEADVAPFNELRSVDPKGTTIPALVWGTTRRSATVVVAVNGTIAGVSPTFTDDRTERRFAMMLPESLLRAGDNHVAAYELDQSAGAPTLHRWAFGRADAGAVRASRPSCCRAAPTRGSRAAASPSTTSQC